MKTEKSEFYRPFWLRFKIQALAWMGIEKRDKEDFLDIDESLFVLRPELVERDLKIADLANDINLHAEMEPGECCCGLKLEYAGMPVEAQIGHTYAKKPTGVFMLERDGEIKLHCQTCNQDWPAFSTECSHYKTHEPVYCHRCMQDHVAAVREHGCEGHDHATAESEGPDDSGKLNTLGEAFSLIVLKANSGTWIYMIAIFGTMALDYTNLRKEAPGIWPIISQGWIVTALIGLVIWLYSVYKGDDKVRSARFKERAVAVFLWAGFGALIPGAVDQVFVIIRWVASGFGLAL